MQPTSNPTSSSTASADQSAPPVNPFTLLRQVGQQTRARIEKLTGAGYRCVPLKLDAPKQLAYKGGLRKKYTPEQFSGHLIGICTGQLADRSYLVRLDIDEHGDDQDAEAAFSRIVPFIDTLPDHFAVKRSTNGQGYDILFRAYRELPNNQPFFIDGVHAGETFCEGGFVRDDEWISGAPETLVPLNDDQLDRLLAVVILRGFNVEGAVSWKTRSREGLVLIHGYRNIDIAPLLNVDEMPKVFQGTKQTNLISQANWRALKGATKGRRSEAFANVIQSLMLRADKSFGQSHDEKCRTVAAIAVACYPYLTDTEGRHVEADTAALIARILHGDPHKNGRGRFRIPLWAQEYRPVVNKRGRRQGDRQGKLQRLRRLLREHMDGDRVERIGDQKLTCELLARHLHVDPRTVRDYLAELEVNDEIQRETMQGGGRRLVIHILPMFGSDSSTKNRPTKVTKEDGRHVERRIANAQKGGSRDGFIEHQDAEKSILADDAAHSETSGTTTVDHWSEDDWPSWANDEASANVAQYDEVTTGFTTAAPEDEVDEAAGEGPSELAEGKLEALHCTLAPGRRRLTEEGRADGFTEAQWNRILINHVIALLNADDYGGARLQAGAMRTSELRRDWIAYVDECWVAAIASEQDDEVFAVAAD